MPDQVFMIVDYETFSECDLKLSGAYEYSMHPSTEILCLGWRVGTRETLAEAPIQIETPDAWEGRALDTRFIRYFCNPQVKLVAHNVFFEQVITANVLTRYTNLLGVSGVRGLPVARWICTAAMSRSCGLPGKLEGAALALGLRHQKDTDGHRVMLRLAKPRKPTKKNPATRHSDAADLQKLYDYCRDDIAAETELFLRLPELNPREREFWELDQEINLRGFYVDRRLVTGALALIDRETERLDSTIVRITGGALNSARQRDATLNYVNAIPAAFALPNMQAGTVREALAQDDLSEHARAILEIREAISRSSTAKYRAFEARSRSDSRARDNTQFYGAHTGRQSGTGLQPQNLFKTILNQKDVNAAVPLIQLKDDLAIEALFEKPMDLYASSLRGAIVASPGHVLDVGDFATVEVRVLFWLAEHAAGLKALAEGREIYIEMAAEIYRLKFEKLLRDYQMEVEGTKKMRQLGKQTVLGAGFGIGIGGTKFQASCRQYGIDISLSLACNAVRAYRELHAPIPKFWRVIEAAAIRALQNPGKRFRHGKLVWKYDGTWLKVRLPIGRCLWYYDPKMIRQNTMYGPRQVLSYMSVDSTTKRFVRETTWGGKLTENVVQAIARDLLMEALDRIRRRTATVPVLAVHDEAVGERRLSGDAAADSVAHRAFLKAMAEVPSWAAGMPIKVEGWCEGRYRK